MRSNRILTSPVRWIGAKSHIRSWIISQFPEHTTYVEPFAGSATVLLNKTPSKVEVYNDQDERLYAIFNVLRDPKRSRQLRRALGLTPYHEKEFQMAWEQPLATEQVEAARQAIVRLRMGFGGAGSRGTKPGFGFGKASNQAAQFAAFCRSIPRITERLSNVQIMCRPALDVIKRFDSVGTLQFCDPPYIPSSRKSARDYVHEMSLEDHDRLAQLLNSLQSKVMLSGYDSEHYRRWYRNWNIRSREVSLRVARDKSQKRREFVWTNF